MQQRDKKGRFLPTGEKTKPRKPFNQRYIKASDVMSSQNDLDAAFLAGFDTARRVNKTFSANSCLQAWREIN